MVEIFLELVNSRGPLFSPAADKIKLPLLPVIGHRLAYKGFTGEVKKVHWDVIGPLDTIITVTVQVD